MVDIHSHILPETDDGARSWEVAIEMCRIAAKDGTHHIVATPHANDQFTYDRASHQETLDRLRDAAALDMQFTLGCDFHFSFENIQDALAHHAKYAIGNTKYMLIELPDYSVSPNTGDMIGRLISAGLFPVLTHPERNPILQRRPELVVEWAGEGCIVQVTANVFSGRWGDKAVKTAQYLLKHDAVHVLASDAHNTTSRSPMMSAGRDAVAKLAGKEVAQALVEDNPAAIVTDKPLPYFPVPRR
jgi:protein-tyrosine phosphatase